MSNNNCRKYYIVYMITNLINKMIYIGKYSTYTPYDMKNYWGSGVYLKAAINKYRKENFKRETLFVFEDEDEAYLKEREIVTLEFVARKDTYNLIVGGRGYGRGENHSGYGLERSEATKKKQKGPRPNMQGENHYLWNKHPTEASRIKNAIAKLGSEIYYQRLKDVEEIEKVRGWKAKLAKKWCVDSSGVTWFLKKWYVEEKEVFYQRLKDIEEIEKVHGWKAKLARKWGVDFSAVASFIKHWYKEEDTYYHQRLKDIEEIEKKHGWKIKLARKWGIDPSSACQFLKKWYVEESTYHLQRLKDIEEVEKVWGWRRRLAVKWEVNFSTASEFVKKWYKKSEVVNAPTEVKPN